jgi:hypothetical protein
LTNGDIQKLYLDADNNGLFEYIKIGDSIIKEYGSYAVEINRKDSTHTFNLD